MSATKSPTARRRCAVAYGSCEGVADLVVAATGGTAPRSRGRTPAWRTHPSVRTPGRWASRISGGPWSPGGWATAVLPSDDAAQLRRGGPAPTPAR